MISLRIQYQNLTKQRNSFLSKTLNRMKENPLRKLQTLGQSIWLDYIRCDMISGGQLKHFIEEDGLLGMTTNPSIFEKAIAESQLYDKVIADLVGKGKNVQDIYETICLRDVQNAADKFKFTFTKTGGKDGYVSMEVNPHLAYDTDGTIKEARRLWAALNRPNVLIKVPATKEGLPAIRQLISEGINVNVTLLFSLERYSEVAEAYIAGIQDRKKEGKAVDKIASVASFFLSRIDALIDPKEEDYAASVVKMSLFASIIRGEVAISSAKLAYKIYQEKFETTEFSQLGASPQRLLWASTSSKNPADGDVKYVEALIGPNTVNTIPLQTFEAYRDHGHPKSTLKETSEHAATVLSVLSEFGIEINDVTRQLEDEGVEKFISSYDQLIKAITEKSAK